MGRLEKLEEEIQSLAPDELARFRDWFIEFDWEAWDRQIERDVDALADEALRDHAEGRTKPL